MSVSTHESATPDKNTPCHHCALPVGVHPVGNGPWFCCSGCQTVHFVLQESGLAETFYKLKSSAPNPEAARAASIKKDPLLLAELDSPEFFADHTVDAEHGRRRAQLYVNGVHCAACVWLVERLPREIEGVGVARLDLPRSRLTLEWDPHKTKLSTIAKWLSRYGYSVQPRVHDHSVAASDEERKLLIRVGVAWALAANVMLIAFSMYAGLDDGGDSNLSSAARWLSLILTIPAVGYVATPFFRRAWMSILDAARRRSVLHLHMDTPISIGIVVGFTNSAIATFTGRGEIWFDSIAVLIAALLTARWIQFRSKRLAGDAADQLLGMVPTSARRVLTDGSVEIVRASALQAEDIVQVPAGEVIPVDGLVHSGTSFVDNSMLTGESEPAPVEVRTEVWAGTTNLSRTIEIRTAAAADETKVGKLLAWVSGDATQRSQVVMLADRLSGYFVVVVLLLAAACGLVWLQVDANSAVSNVVALLVITCPCALGMATPLAMAVGIGRAARIGIFVKNEASVQTLTTVDTVVLDKTGTLTYGRPSVSDYVGDKSAIARAAVLEMDNNHPIAQALRVFQGSIPLNSDHLAADVQVEIGKGISGWIDGELVAVGRLDWLTERATISETLKSAETTFAASGATPVGICIGDKVVTVVAVTDELRPDSYKLVHLLGQKGIEPVICSGDHPGTVARIADLLGIRKDQIYARSDPQSKRDIISRLVDSGKIVAMIGDGVNDVGALQRAQVGIAVSGSSTAGQIASDIFITGRGIDRVTDLFLGADRIMRVIRLNLGISLAYNLAGATAAMLGLVTPLVAAIAMPISSLVVVILSSAQRPFATKTS